MAVQAAFGSHTWEPHRSGYRSGLRRGRHRHLLEDASVVTSQIKCNRICQRNGSSSGIWEPHRSGSGPGDSAFKRPASTGRCNGRRSFNGLLRNRQNQMQSDLSTEWQFKRRLGSTQKVSGDGGRATSHLLKDTSVVTGNQTQSDRPSQGRSSGVCPCT